MQHVTRTVPRVLVKEIPVERIRVEKKIVYVDIEELEYVPLPYIVQTEVINEVVGPGGSSGGGRGPVSAGGGASAGADMTLEERVTQVPKPKLIPVDKEVVEFVPQYVDVAVDESGLPLHPAPPVEQLLRGW